MTTSDTHERETTMKTVRRRKLPTPVPARQAKPKMATKIPRAITIANAVKTRLGTLNFFDGFSDKATVEKCYDHLDFLRGASVVAIRQGAREAGFVKGIAINPDTSVDVYFGPKPPAGKETIGYRPLPAKAGTSFSASTARSNPGSIKPGGPEKSNW
jgi:hypothetical protein